MSEKTKSERLLEELNRTKIVDSKTAATSSNMRRKHVFLTANQVEALELMADRRGIGFSEIIRRFIDQQIDVTIGRGIYAPPEELERLLNLSDE